MPKTGSYTVAVLAGVTDVDAITLSMAERARQEQTAVDVAVLAIMLASFSNTLAKTVMAASMGRGLKRWLLLPGLAMVALGALTLWLV
jgi:uncharacterized membrane protein (DUF4010 family)